MDWTESCDGGTGRETTEIWVRGAMKEMKCDEGRCGASEDGWIRRDGGGVRGGQGESEGAGEKLRE